MKQSQSTTNKTHQTNTLKETITPHRFLNTQQKSQNKKGNDIYRNICWCGLLGKKSRLSIQNFENTLHSSTQTNNNAPKKLQVTTAVYICLCVYIHIFTQIYYKLRTI